jgi:hypothetical protein
MRRRFNLLALWVIAAGGGVLAGPAPVHATYLDPFRPVQEMSCCRAFNTLGTIYRCCYPTGCIVNEWGCMKL